MRFTPAKWLLGVTIWSWLSGLVWSACAQESPPSRQLTIEADVWCPINCDPTSPRPGIGIDLAKKIFEPLGYKINYVLVPWTKALEDVRAGKADAVVGANRHDDPNLFFPENAITDMTDDFYVLKGNPWRYQGDYTLKGMRIGIIADYGYGDIVTKFIAENKNMAGIINTMSGNDALPQNIRELLAHDIDVIIESKQVMDYTLQGMRLEDQIIWAGGVPQAPVFLAFSPVLPESRERVMQYDQGIRKLKSADALEMMYTPYRLKP